MDEGQKRAVSRRSLRAYRTLEMKVEPDLPTHVNVDEETGESSGSINGDAADVRERRCSDVSAMSVAVPPTSPLLSGSASPSNQPLKIPPPKPSRAVGSPLNGDFSSFKRKRDGTWRSASSESLQLMKKIKRKLSICDLLDDLLLYIFLFLLDEKWFVETVPRVCNRWYKVFQHQHLWEGVHPTKNGKVNPLAFRYYDLKNKGTEGLCFKVRHRASGQYYAMKKARVYPKGEGVPYYMLRELAFLQGLYHPHIATLERIALSDNELYVFFKYVENSLFDLINPSNDPNGGRALPEKLTKKFLYQVVQGVAFCHQRGVLHRNLKPKHLLVDIPNLPEELQKSSKKNENDKNKKSFQMNESNRQRFCEHAEKHASIKMSDFALVRSTSIPLRSYTAEVVTLWYRAPEVLMGGRYFAAVDMWSVGCVFAEMALGKPLFPGICEIDQLFQIFSKLGTPSEETWKEFEKLPNYAFKFPNWKARPLKLLFPNLEESGADLLGRMLDVNPDRRITAEDALKHPYFDSIKEEEGNVPDQLQMSTKGPSGRTTSHVRQPKGNRGGLAVSSRKLKAASDEHQTLSTELGLSKKLHYTCWEWFRNGASSQRLRRLPGLADPAYLVSYYQYLKQLEAELFPLNHHVLLQKNREPVGNAGDQVGSVTAAAGNGNSNSNTSANGNEQNNGDSPHSILQPVHRAMLVDWLVEVIDVFEMSLRSVFLAVNYTDRYLSIERVERQNFQLLGATCLHIASKCEDVSYIGVEDLVICADKVYKAEHVLKLEEKVLTTLDFRLAVPTVIDFLNSFAERLMYDEEGDENLIVQQGSAPEIDLSNRQDLKKRATQSLPNDKGKNETSFVPKQMVPTDKSNFLARYMAELSLQDSEFLVELPSKTAAAALVLALHYTNIKVYDSRIKAVSGYSLHDLKGCILKMQKTHHEAGTTSQLVVIKKRYEKESFMEVADISPIPIKTLF